MHGHKDKQCFHASKVNAYMNKENTINKPMTGKALFQFLQARFNMTEDEALDNMEEHGHQTGLLRAELDINGRGEQNNENKCQ